VHANSAAEVPARLEALAAPGGLDAAALHAQLAAAIRVLVHLDRDRAGHRRVGEIAVLAVDPDRRCRAVTAWSSEHGAGPGETMLRTLLNRGRP
jgi:pilus assembly protein CpaF